MVCETVADHVWQKSYQLHCWVESLAYAYKQDSHFFKTMCELYSHQEAMSMKNESLFPRRIQYISNMNCHEFNKLKNQVP